jgi:ATP-dependent protease ClpP protease subunit
VTYAGEIFNEQAGLLANFRNGDYVRFRANFRRNEAVIGIDLSSEGGYLEEGMQIANLTYRKKLAVYVVEECDSVCVFIFFAAAARYRFEVAKSGAIALRNPRRFEGSSATLAKWLSNCRPAG